jgi:hypothetical protein
VAQARRDTRRDRACLCSSAWAIATFSSSVKDTPGACSPSRKVLSFTPKVFVAARNVAATSKERSSNGIGTLLLIRH